MINDEANNNSITPVVNQNIVLVTGATGLLGSHLIKELLKEGKKIKALYRNEEAIKSFAKSDLVSWVKADILDISSLEDAMQQVSEVYHCAALVSFNPKKKEELIKINVEGTANVINACLNAGVQKLVHVSSVAALGRMREDETINETMNWTEETSNSVYGQSKYLAEMEVWRGIAEGLKAIMVNPTIILGAGIWTNGSTEIFKSVYEEFPFYTEGITGFVDVEDVSKVMVQLMNSDLNAQRFIVSAENKSYKDLFALIADNFKRKRAKYKVTPFIAGIVWRWEAIKSLFSGKGPLLTKETAATALAKVYFDNSSLLNVLPAFSYTPIEKSIERICLELKNKNKLQ